jgi:hypothetical protein
MKELLRLGVFLLFLGLGVRVALADAPVRRQRVNALLIYILCVSAAAGLLQRDTWPFAAYRIFYHSFSPGHVTEILTLRVIASAGAECEVAPRFTSPVSLPVVLDWLDRTYPRLSEAQQQRAMAFLFDRARESADRAAQRQDSALARALGWLVPPPHWALYSAPSPDDFRRCVPPTGIRLYHNAWRARERLQGSEGVTRHLVAEYQLP